MRLQHTARKAVMMLALLLLLSGATACAGASTAGAPPAPTTTVPPTPTATLPPIPMRDVTFSTADHVLLSGVFLGSGHTVVIFSNQTDSFASDWLPTAKQFAARGYGALVYDYRGHRESQGSQNLVAGPTDLEGAITFARQQGARTIVLVGASIGGTITANAAAAVQVAAVAIFSSPRVWPGLDVTDTLMRSITAPKFLADSEGDEYASDIQAMYNAANSPKELHMYPGSDHGIALFYGDNSATVLQQLLTFVQRYAPAS